MGCFGKSPDEVNGSRGLDCSVNDMEVALARLGKGKTFISNTDAMYSPTKRSLGDVAWVAAGGWGSFRSFRFFEPPT